MTQHGTTEDYSFRKAFFGRVVASLCSGLIAAIGVQACLYNFYENTFSATLLVVMASAFAIFSSLQYMLSTSLQKAFSFLLATIITFSLTPPLFKSFLAFWEGAL